MASEEFLSNQKMVEKPTMESRTRQAFFWTFRKKLKAKKTQAEKKLKQIFEKLKQIIQKLNNLPTKNWLFAQKSLEVDI